MGQLENNLRIRTERGLKPNQRLWRANSGHAWEGEFLTKNDFFRRFKIKIFFPVLIKLRKIILWPPGTPDMIGFDSIVITPEMVGKKVAVFVGSELKATKADRLKPAQTNFKKMLVSMGGIHREHRETGEIIQSDNLFP